MNLTAEWHDPGKRLIVLTMKHGWTWEEWDTIVEKILSMRASVSYPVDLIIDAIDSPEMPTIRVTPQVRQSWEALPNDGSLVLVVGVYGFLRELTKMMARLTGAQDRVFFCDLGRRSARHG